MEGDLTPSPPEPRYLFGIPERIADNLYDTGKATVSKVPELRPFVHLPCPSHQSLGSISNLGTCGYYTYCFPQYLNVSIQNLKLFRPRTRERKKELISQPLLHTTYSLGLYPDQATWAAQRARRAPTPVAPSTPSLSLHPPHFNKPHSFSSPAWLLCMWSSAMAWCVMG